MIFRQALFQIVFSGCLVTNASVLLSSPNAAAVVSDPSFSNDNFTGLAANDSSLHNTSTTFAGDYLSNALPCDIDRFGPVIPKSCLEARDRLKAIGPADRTFTWADRDYRYWSDFQIPYRFSSSDGTCVIDVFHKDGVYGDKATVRSISEAVWLINEVCITSRRRPAQGGCVKELGEKKNLGVVLSRYYPKVTCWSFETQVRNHGSVLRNSIPTNQKPLNFGPRSRAGVDVTLPQIFKAVEGEWVFELKIETFEGSRVRASWRQIWEAFNAIDAMCGSKGRAGFSVLTRSLYIELSYSRHRGGAIEMPVSNNNTDPISVNRHKV